MTGVTPDRCAQFVPTPGTDGVFACVIFPNLDPKIDSHIPDGARPQACDRRIPEEMFRLLSGAVAWKPQDIVRKHRRFVPSL